MESIIVYFVKKKKEMTQITKIRVERGSSVQIPMILEE
jgi:hypothetical protein